MTRIQKRKLISACLVAGTVILLTAIGVVYYYVRTAHLSDKGYTLYTLGLLAWLVIYLVVIFIINRKKKVVLTSDERRQVLPPQLTRRLSSKRCLIPHGLTRSRTAVTMKRQKSR